MVKGFEYTGAERKKLKDRKAVKAKMPGPQPIEIELDDETLKALQKVVNQHKSQQQQVQRAKIIL